MSGCGFLSEHRIRKEAGWGFDIHGDLGFTRPNFAIKDTTNNRTFLSTTNSGALTINAIDSGVTVTYNGATRIVAQTAGVAFFGSMSAGGGSGVIFIANRTTAPTSNPSAGGLLYAESGALKWRGSSGTVTELAPA
jgi:hypothetical protein